MVTTRATVFGLGVGLFAGMFLTWVAVFAMGLVGYEGALLAPIAFTVGAVTAVYIGRLTFWHWTQGIAKSPRTP